MTNTAVVSGSVAAIAQRDQKSIAHAFMSATEIILVDTSGSMEATDSTGGQSRYDVACQELRKLQAVLPGKLAIFAYSSNCVFCPSGTPMLLSENTNLLGALKYVLGADGTVNYTVISDGYPNPGQDLDILALVKSMSSRVNAIFAGAVEDIIGRDFMNRLAAAGRGRMETSAKSEALSDSVIKLLEGGSK